MKRRMAVPRNGFGRPPIEPGIEADPMRLPTKVVLDPHKLLAMLTEVATHAWKAKQRLAKSLGTATGSDPTRVLRHVDGILDSLAKLGVEIKDHTGDSFDYGQSLKVVASQPREGITHEVVAETIRPTLFLSGHRIQQGEVVIDTPQNGRD